MPETNLPPLPLRLPLYKTSFKRIAESPAELDAFLKKLERLVDARFPLCVRCEQPLGAGQLVSSDGAQHVNCPRPMVGEDDVDYIRRVRGVAA